MRSFKNFDKGSSCSNLSLVPFSTAYVFDDPEDVYWAWEKLFVEVLDEHAPVKSFRRKHGDQFQFINPELREVMRELRPYMEWGPRFSGVGFFCFESPRA